jgi:adenylate kinase
LAQAKSLDEYLSGRGAALDAVLALQVDEAELVQRLMARGRADDRPEAIKERFQEFETQTRPILRYYQEQGLLREIDGMGAPDAIYQRMVGCL